MRIYPIPLIAVLLFFVFSANAQQDARYALLLKSGAVYPTKNISPGRLDSLNNRTARTGGKTFAVLQFEQLPTLAERQQLLQEGIELLDYIPNNAYTVTITGSLSETVLQRVRARAIIEPTAQQKMTPELARGAVRVSLGAANSEAEVDEFINALRLTVGRLQGLTALAV